VFTPTRVPQGATDSALHFQNQMQLVFSDMLYHEILIWIDDLLLHARSPAAFIETLRRFFDRVRVNRLKLSAKKSCLFKKHIKWCGRVFSGDGIQHDTTRISALQELPLPTTAADLQQFLCASGWMRESIADYGRAMQPLHAKLERALKQVGRTKKLAAGAILDWNKEDREAFSHAVKILGCSQKLHFPAADAIVCMFSDASERGWGLLVTQVLEWQAGRAVVEQQHELLICKSGVFDAAAQRWSIIEKEAFPIVWAARNLDYLLVRAGGFQLYCDHKNLIYVFAPDAEVKRHIRGKLQRWAMSLTGLPYSIEHIEGPTNLWADLLSRWGLAPTKEMGAGPSCKYVATRQQTREAETEERGQRLSSGNFTFPTKGEILRAQQRHLNQRPQASELAPDGLWTVKGLVWAPSSETRLLQRLFVVAHCGLQGHRGLEPMMATIKVVFWVDQLAPLCRRFLSRCLLCKHVKGGNVIPRPWGPTYNASRRNELLHWDFLYMGPSSTGSKYVLVLKDGLTHYCELVACDAPTSVVAAAALIDWWKRFGPPSVLISYQRSHFKNDVVSQVCKRLGAEQELVLAYAPWINGSVERLNRDILQVMRVLLMDLKLDTREWEYLLPLVQGNLNHTPVLSLGRKAPVELFTALPRPTPFQPIIVERGTRTVVLSEQPTMPLQEVEKLQESLAVMHREVLRQRETKRQQSKEQSTCTPCNFSVGDYVLWPRIDSRLSVNKLLARWVGPFVAVETRPHSFVIRHLVTKAQYEVHGSRLKFYSDASLDVNEELLAHVGNQWMVLVVERLKGHRKERDGWQLLVSWQGLQDEEDSWEPLRAMNEDIPARVTEYVGSSDDHALQSDRELTRRQVRD
jgi:transposase InsO family protein